MKLLDLFPGTFYITGAKHLSKYLMECRQEIKYLKSRPRSSDALLTQLDNLGIELTKQISPESTATNESFA